MISLDISIWDGVALGVAGVFLAYWLFLRRKESDLPPRPPRPPPMKKQDMTLEQLSAYEGSGDHGRLCIAVDNKIFDVTMASHLYGKQGPYGLFAGHDASRGLATFSIEPSALKDEYDDLSDLSPSEINSMKEWAAQFQEKYPVVGRLLRPGEEPDVYSDDEEEQTAEAGNT